MGAINEGESRSAVRKERTMFWDVDRIDTLFKVGIGFAIVGAILKIYVLLSLI